MWHRLRKQIAVERELLNRHLADHRPLLRKCARLEPDRIELSALAATLHSFYSGVRQVFS